MRGFKLILMVVFLTCLSAVPVMAEQKNLTLQYREALYSSHAEVLNALLKTESLQNLMAQRNRQLDGFIEVLKKDRGWNYNVSLQQSIVQNATADKFRRLIANTKLSFAEIMLTDQMGALIAAYPLTTDYWQGDEAKFVEAATLGEKYFSQQTWDESTQTYSFFVSIPIKTQGVVEGVLIAGLDVTKAYIADMPFDELMNLNITDLMSVDVGQ